MANIFQIMFMLVAKLLDFIERWLRPNEVDNYPRVSLGPLPPKRDPPGPLPPKRYPPIETQNSPIRKRRISESSDDSDHYLDNDGYCRSCSSQNSHHSSIRKSKDQQRYQRSQDQSMSQRSQDQSRSQTSQDQSGSQRSQDQSGSQDQSSSQDQSRSQDQSSFQDQQRYEDENSSDSEYSSQSLSDSQYQSFTNRGISKRRNSRSPDSSSPRTVYKGQAQVKKQPITLKISTNSSDPKKFLNLKTKAHQLEPNKVDHPGLAKIETVISKCDTSTNKAVEPVVIISEEKPSI